MNTELSKRLLKICTTCDQNETCPRSSQMARKCYQGWYNRTQRDADAEKLRLALYRHKNFAKWMLTRCKSQATKIGLEFDLDLEWFKHELGKGTCAVTGLDFVTPKYDPGARGKRNPWTPSVDRIDNTKGYSKSNCRLVVWMYNLAKSNYAEEDVMRMCGAIVDKQLQADVGDEMTQTSLSADSLSMHQSFALRNSPCVLEHVPGVFV